MCGYFCIRFSDFMFGGKKLTDFTSLFCPYDLKKKWPYNFVISKINEIDKTNLTNETKFRLNEISKFEKYFNSEINKTKICSKKLSKYVAAFDCIDKILIILSATSGAVCIISSVSVVGAPIVAGAFYSCIFLTTKIIKKLLSITRNKKKHDKILMLAKSKLNSIET